MRTRPLLLTACVFALTLVPAWSQSTTTTTTSVTTKPAAAPVVVVPSPAPVVATPVPTTPSPEAPPASVLVPTPPPDVVIKDAATAHPAATKAKNSAGNETLSVDFPDEDIRNILRNVADLFELNLVIPETLQGKASIKLRDVTWRQIFQVVLTPVGYSYIEDGNIIKIVSNESLQQEPVTTEVFVLNYARASDISPTIGSLVTSQGSKIVVDSRSNSLVITETPSRMNRIRPIIEQLDKATDQVMIESKFVEVTDSDVRNIGVNWASLKSYKLGVGPGGENGALGTVSRNRGQTASDGFTVNNGTTSGTNNSNTTNNTSSNTNGSTTTNTVTSTNGTLTTTSATGGNGSITNTTTVTGINGTSGATNNALNLLQSLTNTGDTARTLSAVFTADQFGIIISALNELNTAKVVSNPTVVTLNNTEATINIGQEYPLPSYTYNEQRGSFDVSGFTYKPIGINLKVTPQVNARGFIKLSVEPEVSSFNDADSVTFGGASGAKIPVIQTKKTKTQISLRDGFTMGIGGLIDSTTSNGETKVPVLGSIPVLGRLFRSNSKTVSSHNLLIFLTAKTIPAEGAPVEQIFDPRQIRQMNIRRDELPGYRDGKDPFLSDSADAPSHKAGNLVQ